MANPYEPTTDVSGSHASDAERREPTSRFAATFAFMVGCAIGLQIGWVLQHGLETAVARTLSLPLTTLITSGIFAGLCAACTIPYRLMQALMGRRYQLTLAQSFQSGLLMVSVGYSINIALERLSLIGTTTPQGMAEWGMLGLIVCFSVVVCVEFEAWIAKRQLCLSLTPDRVP